MASLVFTYLMLQIEKRKIESLSSINGGYISLLMMYKTSNGTESVSLVDCMEQKASHWWTVTLKSHRTRAPSRPTLL